MKEQDHTLQDLWEQAARQKKLRAEKESLAAQKEELGRRVRELDRIRSAEQADVDRLEGRTLAAFFYAAIGKREEKLSREQREAYAAAVKYDAAVRELEAVRYDLDRVCEELDALRGCEERFRAAADRKAEEVKAAGIPEAARILRLEERLRQNGAGQKEVGEAVCAGQAALSTAESVLGSLDSAEGWGTWDLVGGGLLTDLAKYGHLDEAQRKVEQLQVQLRRFHTELADTRICADLRVEVDGFLRFADYFFDGLFADWAVLDHISSSKGEVSRVCRQLQDTLEALRQTADGLQRECRAVRTELDELLVSI